MWSLWFLKPILWCRYVMWPKSDVGETNKNVLWNLNFTVEKFTWILFYSEKAMHPTLVLLLGKSHGWRRLVGCSPWGHWGLDTTERLHFHFSLSCIGEGNGNPLQCSCLENPRDGGAWWAAIYGVVQSRTWLNRLSSSSSIIILFLTFLSWIYLLHFDWVSLFVKFQLTLI